MEFLSRWNSSLERRWLNTLETSGGSATQSWGGGLGGGESLDALNKGLRLSLTVISATEEAQGGTPVGWPKW